MVVLNVRFATNGMCIAAQAFWSQHMKCTPLSFTCPMRENDQIWTLEMAPSKVFQAQTAHIRSIQPINRPWTDGIYSFPHQPTHGPLNNWQSCLFCLLRENISKGYFAFWGNISAETILPFVEHDWLKWTCHVTSTINKVTSFEKCVSLKP